MLSISVFRLCIELMMLISGKNEVIVRLPQSLSWTFSGRNEALVQSKSTFAVQFYSKPLLASRFFEVFSIQTVTKLSTCITNIVFGTLLNYPLREVTAQAFFLIGVFKNLMRGKISLLCFLLQEQSQNPLLRKMVST
ncbi:hypothetical protein LWI29_016453 [Acer saccharum]|uniref:Uncharacterized protein n=1 Tax=Acer saccharum TaxID=4024 RepID=A0AA39ST87_ACESA|nr:hypothetical protein LWI29_016453 [Acer saccharum]